MSHEWKQDLLFHAVEHRNCGSERLFCDHESSEKGNRSGDSLDGCVQCPWSHGAFELLFELHHAQSGTVHLPKSAVVWAAWHLCVTCAPLRCHRGLHTWRLQMPPLRVCRRPLHHFFRGTHLRDQLEMAAKEIDFSTWAWRKDAV